MSYYRFYKDGEFLNEIFAYSRDSAIHIARPLKFDKVVRRKYSIDEEYERKNKKKFDVLDMENDK